MAEMTVRQGGSAGNDGESRGATRGADTLGDIMKGDGASGSAVSLSDVWGKETNQVRRDGVKSADTVVGDLRTDRGSRAGTDAGVVRQ